MPGVYDVEKAACVSGVLTNSLLLYCIRRHTQTSLGAYKQLLTLFASVDILLCILHLIVEPRLTIVNTTFGFASATFLDARASGFYATCFTGPFALMNIHFLYRYWSVNRPHLIELFSSVQFIALLVAVPTSAMIGWYAIEMTVMSEIELTAKFERKHGWNITGFILLDHWRHDYEPPSYIPTMIFFDVMIVASFAMAATLGTLTLLGLRNKTKFSPNKRKHEMRLLTALSAQTAVPLIFVYIPYFFCLNLPMFGIPVEGLASVSLLLNTLFPAWDAVVIMLLMTDYRLAVIAMLGMSKKPKKIEIAQQAEITTSHQKSSLLSLKFVLALTAVILLWMIRSYERKILVHKSLSSLLRFHYYYMNYFLLSCCIDLFLTLFKYQFRSDQDFSISSVEHFSRRFFQNLSVYGTVASMFMMSIERHAASRNLQTYENSRENSIYFSIHIIILLLSFLWTIQAYDFRTRFAVSTAVPEGGQIYYQILGSVLIVIEFVTIVILERLFKMNNTRIHQIECGLSERYQLTENIRMLELLRPLAHFHGVSTCLSTIFFILFGQSMKDDISYPIFEEAINMIQLQGIFMPIIFMRHERKERAARLLQLEKNNCTSADFVSRYDSEITRGW